jgi:hypothetical protein
MGSNPSDMQEPSIDTDKLSYKIFSILESKFMFGYDNQKLWIPKPIAPAPAKVQLQAQYQPAAAEQRKRFYRSSSGSSSNGGGGFFQWLIKDVHFTPWANAMAAAYSILNFKFYF